MLERCLLAEDCEPVDESLFDFAVYVLIQLSQLHKRFLGSTRVDCYQQFVLENQDFYRGDELIV